MKRDMSAILITVGIVVLAVCAIASVPHLINYQGVLTDSGGVPISGSHDLTFVIYPDSTLSAPVYWTETHVGVQFEDGLFHVILGGTTTIPEGLFADEVRWIGITVDETPEMKPRQQITSVPWAFHAAVADTVLSGGGGVGDGHSLDAADGDPVDVVYVDNDGHVGIGTTSPIAPFHVASGSTVLLGADTLGAGSKLMWLPSKSAFRAGVVLGTQWDWDNIGDYSIAMGRSAKASGNGSIALGNSAGASGVGSTAMGYVATATGDYGATALGNTTTASGNASTAMGILTYASGYVSTSMGAYTLASGQASTAMGWETTASGYTSTAMGLYTTASGNSSTAMGEYTKAESFSSMAIGKYNVGGGSPDSWVLTDPLFEIGYGSVSGRKNAITVLKNGRVGIRTTSPAYLLQVGRSGDGSQARANVWNLLSSREYKTDIESFAPSDYREVLAGVKSTEVVRYRFANDEKKVQHIGIIAEDSPREILSSDGKGVSLGDYCAFLLAAIKAQQEQIEELRGEIEQLKLKD